MVSKVIAELADVFDCEEDLMMLSDGAVEMSIDQMLTTTAWRRLFRTVVLGKSVTTYSHAL
jgi:hypothetical protein